MNTETKPQKSDLWIWTTLWLTTLLDSAFIYIALLFVSLFFLHSYLNGISLNIFDWIVLVISIYLGSLVSVNYVIKRSVVLKDKSSSLAFKTMLIPIIFLIIGIILSISKGTLATDYLNIQSIRWLFIIVVIFFSVQQLILKKGE